MIDFPWPQVKGCKNPSWVGNGFKVANRITPILSYEIDSSGWTSDLTVFHEKNAGMNHFIDTASRKYAIGQLFQNIKKEESPIILEIGCSSGFMLKMMQESIPNALIIGADIVREPLECISSRIPGIPLLQFNLVKCPLPSSSIDAVVLLNVLEHIEDDYSALTQIHRIIKPGGVLLLEVPSGTHLYNHYDKLLMHYRRYNMEELIALLRRVGFDNIVRKSHLGFIIYPGFWFLKYKDKLIYGKNVNKSRIAKQISVTKYNNILHHIMKFEMFIGKRISYPFGIRCTVCCIK